MIPFTLWWWRDLSEEVSRDRSLLAKAFKAWRWVATGTIEILARNGEASSWASPDTVTPSSLLSFFPSPGGDIVGTLQAPKSSVIAERQYSRGQKSSLNYSQARFERKELCKAQICERIAHSGRAITPDELAYVLAAFRCSLTAKFTSWMQVSASKLLFLWAHVVSRVLHLARCSAGSTGRDDSAHTDRVELCDASKSRSCPEQPLLCGVARATVSLQGHFSRRLRTRTAAGTAFSEAMMP